MMYSEAPPSAPTEGGKNVVRFEGEEGRNSNVKKFSIYSTPVYLALSLFAPSDLSVSTGNSARICSLLLLSLHL